jgi:hypothetical protein
MLYLNRFLTATLCGSLLLSCLSAVATDPIEPAWTPDHKRASYCEEDDNASCHMTDDWEYDPASNTWVLPQYTEGGVTVADGTAPMAGTTIVDGTAKLGSAVRLTAAAPCDPTTQVIFLGMEGMTGVCGNRDCSGCASEPMEFPQRHNFVQGSICGLKLASVPDHPEVELHATIEMALQNARTARYLEMNSVPVAVTGKDVEAVLSGKRVTKVVYMPSPEFQGLVLGVRTFVSYGLDPGADPLAKAARRGDIMLVLRIEPRATIAVERCVEARPARTCRPARYARRLRCRFGRR